MGDNGILHQGCAAVEGLADQLAEIVEMPIDLTRPVSPEWSVRDAVVHLAAVSRLYADLASGGLSPVSELTPTAVSVCQWGDPCLLDGAPNPTNHRTAATASPGSRTRISVR